MPTFKDEQINGQILSDFENMARTNTLFNRRITRYQQQPNWADGHVEIGAHWRHNATPIYLTGNLNEREKNTLEDIVSKLKVSYNREVELKVFPPDNGAKTNLPDVNTR